MNRIILNFVVEIQHLTATWDLIENHLNHLPDHEGHGAKDRLEGVQKKLLRVISGLKTYTITLKLEKSEINFRMKTMTTSVIKTESGEAEGSQLHDELRKIDATLHIAKRTRRNAMNYLINKTRHGWDDDILENTVSLISLKILL